jgi:hypothetical protein
MRNIGLYSCALAVAITATVQAATVDLSSSGSSGTVNGALILQSSVQPAGTGVIDSFLRIQANGTEQGYNSGFRPVQFDELTDPNFNRALSLASLSPTTVNGTSYYCFAVDLNEPNSGTAGKISLDQLKIFQTNTANITGYNNTNNTFSSPSTLVYNLDGAGDTSVLLADLSSGSGQSDYMFLIPTSLFNPANGSNVVLYSQFSGTAGGFEEWFSCGPGDHVIPLPGAFGLTGLGMLLVGLRRKS